MFCNIFRFSLFLGYFHLCLLVPVRQVNILNLLSICYFHWIMVFIQIAHCVGEVRKILRRNLCLPRVFTQGPVTSVWLGGLVNPGALLMALCSEAAAAHETSMDQVQACVVEEIHVLFKCECGGTIFIFVWPVTESIIFEYNCCICSFFKSSNCGWSCCI